MPRARLFIGFLAAAKLQAKALITKFKSRRFSSCPGRRHLQRTASSTPFALLSEEFFGSGVLRGQIDPHVGPRGDLLEGRVHQADQVQAAELAW